MTLQPITQLEVPPYLIDAENRRVTVDGKPVQLTSKEFELAWMLFSHVGSVQSRTQLLAKLWPHAQQWETRTVDTHISRVRRKLDIGEHRGWKLSTRYGFGYCLERVPMRARGMAPRGAMVAPAAG